MWLEQLKLARPRATSFKRQCHAPSWCPKALRTAFLPLSFVLCFYTLLMLCDSQSLPCTRAFVRDVEGMLSLISRSMRYNTVSLPTQCSFIERNAKEQRRYHSLSRHCTALHNSMCYWPVCNVYDSEKAQACDSSGLSGYSKLCPISPV